MRTWLPVISAPDAAQQNNWRCIIMAADGFICLLPDKKLSCIGVIEEAIDKMSFWQKIFAYLMVLSLLLIFARVWC